MWDCGVVIMAGYFSRALAALGAAAVTFTALPAYGQAQAPKLREGQYKKGGDICFVKDLKGDALSAALSGTSDGHSIDCTIVEGIEDREIRVFRTGTRNQDNRLKLTGVYYYYNRSGAPIKARLFVPQNDFDKMDRYNALLAGYAGDGSPEYEGEKDAFGKTVGSIVTEANYFDVEKVERELGALKKRLKK